MVSRQIVKPNRLISLFYVLMKSVLDYGSELYLIQPFKTVRAGIIMLVKKTFKRTLRLKSGALDRVIWQMIGKPEDEWRRKMLRISDGLDLPNHIEYQGLLMRKKQRRDLRKRLNWVVILVANTPFNAPQKCSKCKKEMRFNHIQDYTSIEEWELMIRIQGVTRLDDSLTKLLEEQQDELVKFWRIYQDIFSQRSTKELRNEFLV